MLDALFDHVLCGMPRPTLKKRRMKRVFGMPAKSCWAIYEIDNVEQLVKSLRRLKMWWSNNAGASLDWRPRSINRLEVKLDGLDVTSASIVQEFLKLS